MQFNILCSSPPDGGPDKAKFGFVRIPYLVAQLWPCCCLPLSPTNGLRRGMPPSGLDMIGLRTSTKPCFIDTVSTITVRKLI